MMNRVQIGYDPAGGPDDVVFVEIRPRMHSFQEAFHRVFALADRQSIRSPGKLGEYPNRAAHARAHRRATELRRRDRRRARTGRPPIRTAAIPRSGPRMLEITNALAPWGTSFHRAGQTAWQFSEGIVEMQRRINESVQALAAMSVPLRFMAGTVTEWTATTTTRPGAEVSSLNCIRSWMTSLTTAGGSAKARSKATKPAASTPPTPPGLVPYGATSWPRSTT